jgi:hypothetical protein
MHCRRWSPRSVLAMAISLALMAARGASAQVRSITVGITPSCPYGLAG